MLGMRIFDLTFLLLRQYFYYLDPVLIFSQVLIINHRY